MKDILRIEEVAQELGVSDRTVRSWINRPTGALRVSRPTKRTALVLRTDLMKFLERFRS